MDGDCVYEVWGDEEEDGWDGVSAVALFDEEGEETIEVFAYEGTHCARVELV